MSGNQRSLPTKERKQMLSLWTGTETQFVDIVKVPVTSVAFAENLQNNTTPDIQPTTLHKTTAKNQNT